MAERRFKAHPQSVPGDFYVEDGMCLSCGVPEMVAPDLIGKVESDGYTHCVWKKQPANPVELEQAFKLLSSQELACHRYAGSDPAILARIDRDVCDHPPALPPRLSTFAPALFNPTLLDGGFRIRWWAGGLTGIVLAALIWFFSQT